MRLNGRVAVVTGAGGGIGRAIAEAFHREGALVVVTDVTGKEKETADQLGERALAVRADASRGDDWATVVEAAATTFGRLDILCNNAGIDGAWAPIAECTEENFDQVIAVNLRGVFLGMRNAIPAMLQSGGGSIINIASVYGLVAAPTNGAYCAAKGGVLQLTRVAAVEYAQAGIRVNALCPAVVDTPIVAAVDPAIVGAAVAMTPLNRIARSDEVAAAAVFLASDESSYITGASLPVDGGYTVL